MYKLFVNHSRVAIRKNFFAECVVHPWNCLNATEHDFNSLTAFNMLLKRSDLHDYLTFHV
jgi:hypothetical protein